MKPYYEFGETPRELSKYVVAGERIVFATRRHWARIAEPVLSVLVGTVLWIVIVAAIPDAPGAVLNVLFFLWFALVVRGLFMFWLWRTDWFVATTTRLLLSYGIVYKKVAMMPLAKVTDMSYNRTIPGRILGYGQFVMESAGQDQALREVNFIPNSDQYYRDLCDEILYKKVANQAHPPVSMLSRQHRASDERGYEPWETQQNASLDIDERPPAFFPDLPTSTTTQELELTLPQPKVRTSREATREFDDDEYDD